MAIFVTNMISEKIRKMIDERFGSPIQYSQQCEVLSMAIKEATGQTLGTTTLKRMLGFVKGINSSRASSLDIIAVYLGCKNYKELLKLIGEDSDISDFSPVESVDAIDLEPGEQIKITYEPGRMLLLSYIGSNLFIVNESRGSKLLKGDKVIIAGFYVGFELLVTDVERGGRHLGSYQAAKQGGLTSVEIVKPSAFN